MNLNKLINLKVDEIEKKFIKDYSKIYNLVIINAQKLLIENFEINRLYAALGYSFGGHLVCLWTT